MSDNTHPLQRELQQATAEIEQLRDQLRTAKAGAAQARHEAHRKLQEFAREVRVPLTSVLGFTDLLSVTHKGNPTELNQLAKAGHQLMSLVTALEESTAHDDSVDEEVTEPPAQIDEDLPATRTILHIEDNETNFRLIERILEDRANINLLWACNGAEGISFAIQHTPALILLDLNLPDSHGREILARLRSNPLTDQIPVIVLSADISPSQIERMLLGGARNYLTKPFDIKRLLCLVDEALAPFAAAAA